MRAAGAICWALAIVTVLSLPHVSNADIFRFLGICWFFISLFGSILGFATVFYIIASFSRRSDGNGAYTSTAPTAEKWESSKSDGLIAKEKKASEARAEELAQDCAIILMHPSKKRELMLYKGDEPTADEKRKLCPPPEHYLKKAARREKERWESERVEACDRDLAFEWQVEEYAWVEVVEEEEETAGPVAKAGSGAAKKSKKPKKVGFSPDTKSQNNDDSLPAKAGRSVPKSSKAPQQVTQKQMKDDAFSKFMAGMVSNREAREAREAQEAKQAGTKDAGALTAPGPTASTHADVGSAKTPTAKDSTVTPIASTDNANKSSEEALAKASAEAAAAEAERKQWETFKATFGRSRTQQDVPSASQPGLMSTNCQMKHPVLEQEYARYNAMVGQIPSGVVQYGRTVSLRCDSCGRGADVRDVVGPQHYIDTLLSGNAGVNNNFGYASYGGNGWNTNGGASQ
ncbi:hypothetical protein LTR85_001235 [Meristemomyces frigidus]|nr:hypothetical protein LTR85_001235 [Meristemomyces frigidus]